MPVCLWVEGFGGAQVMRSQVLWQQSKLEWIIFKKKESKAGTNEGKRGKMSQVGAEEFLKKRSI